MRADLRAAMPGSTAWCICSAPVRLMAMSFSHCAGSVLTKGRDRLEPGTGHSRLSNALMALAVHCFPLIVGMPRSFSVAASAPYVCPSPPAARAALTAGAISRT